MEIKVRYKEQNNRYNKKTIINTEKIATVKNQQKALIIEEKF